MESAQSRQKRLESVKKWKATNAEKVREYKRRYYLKNREAILEQQRKRYVEENDAYSGEIRRRHYAENRERVLEKQRRWAAKNPEKRRSYKLRREYGITPEHVAEMHTRQDGECALCQKKLLPGRGTNIDHCHRTGKVRGLLCPACNLWLGHLEKRLAKHGYDGVARELDYIEAGFVKRAEKAA